MPAGVRYIRCQKSASPDVVDYRMYLSPKKVPITYASPFLSLGLGSPYKDNPTQIEFDLLSYPDISKLSGHYNMGIAAVDFCGNISDIIKQNGVLFQMDHWSYTAIRVLRSVGKIFTLYKSLNFRKDEPHGSGVQS